MQLSHVLTAAFAAGVMAFAIGTAEGAPLSLRADQSLSPARTVSLAKSPTATVEKKKGRHARKSTLRKNVVHRHVAKRSKIKLDMTRTASIGSEVHAGAGAADAGGDGTQYSRIIARYAASYGVPVSLAKAVIKIESNYRPHMVGSAGEIGLMQIKPSTARMLGYNGSAKGLFNPETNIRYGMKYLAMAQDLGDGTTCGTILKYNAGHAATRMNPVSSAYCAKVKVQLVALGSPA